MNTKDLMERTELLQQTVELIHRAERRIQSRMVDIEMYRGIDAREMVMKCKRDNQITLAAIERLKQRAGRLSFGLFRDLSNVTTIYRECNDVVKAIENHWYSERNYMEL